MLATIVLYIYRFLFLSYSVGLPPPSPVHFIKIIQKNVQVYYIDYFFLINVNRPFALPCLALLQSSSRTFMFR